MNIYIVRQLLAIVDRGLRFDSERFLYGNVLACVTVDYDDSGGMSVDQVMADPVLGWIVDRCGSGLVLVAVQVDYV